MKAAASSANGGLRLCTRTVEHVGRNETLLFVGWALTAEYQHQGRINGCAREDDNSSEIVDMCGRGALVQLPSRYGETSLRLPGVVMVVAWTRRRARVSTVADESHGFVVSAADR